MELVAIAPHFLECAIDARLGLGIGAILQPFFVEGDGLLNVGQALGHLRFSSQILPSL
jgi:hypothetical protein